MMTLAKGIMQPLLDRMPVVIEPEAGPLWFGETMNTPTALMRQPATKCFTVGRSAGCTIRKLTA